MGWLLFSRAAHAAGDVSSFLQDGAAGAHPAGAPVEVRLGVFLSHVPMIDLQENSFKFDAYVWLRWDPSHWPPPSARGQETAPASPRETLQVVDAVELEVEETFMRPGYCCLHIQGKRLNFWDVRDYPFDRQRLELVFEDESFDERELRYVPDTENSEVSESMRVPGSIPRTAAIGVSSYTYPTTFGDPDLESGYGSSYSRVTFGLSVDRDGAGMFFKLFTALFVATLVSMISLFIRPTQVDPRFGLSVGGLFCIVASGYAVNSVLPDASGLSYADKLHLGASLCVLLIVAESAYSLSLHLNKGEDGARFAKRLDRATFLVVASGYAITVLVLTLQIH